MQKRIFGFLGVSFLALSGCGTEDAAISEFTVATDDGFVSQALPAIRRACPGLDKYSKQFKNIRTENNFRTSILFDVPESARIPDAYKAGGHTCFLEIGSDGKNMFIEKLACKSICLDQVNTPDGQLKLALELEK